MKSIFLFSTRLRVYWVEIPIILLMTVTLHYNTHSEALFGLYPLIVFCALAMVFVLIYFFRGIQISMDEIRYVGLFSSRDKAMINEGKTLIIDIMRGGRLNITLFGNDGVTAGLDWLKGDGTPRDIDLFRGKAIGGRLAARRVLEFFSVESDAIEALIKDEDEVRFDYELVTASAEMIDGHRRINLRINKTI